MMRCSEETPVMPPSIEFLLFGALPLLTLGASFGLVALRRIRHDDPTPARTMVLGPYALLEKIAAGSMGEVYRARDSRSGHLRAVKVLSRHAGPRDVEQFEREARWGSALRHPNLVAVHDYGHAPDGTRFFAMDLLEGTTLEEL